MPQVHKCGEVRARGREIPLKAKSFTHTHLNITSVYTRSNVGLSLFSYKNKRDHLYFYYTVTFQIIQFSTVSYKQH